MFGQGDGAWIDWVGRKTVEEGRHSMVLRFPFAYNILLQGFIP